MRWGQAKVRGFPSFLFLSLRTTNPPASSNSKWVLHFDHSNSAVSLVSVFRMFCQLQIRLSSGLVWGFGFISFFNLVKTASVYLLAGWFVFSGVFFWWRRIMLKNFFFVYLALLFILFLKIPFLCLCWLFIVPKWFPSVRGILVFVLIEIVFRFWS